MPVSSLSPYLICDHIHDCGAIMRQEITRYKNGKIQSVRFYCDPCKQGFEDSLQHAMGQMVPYEAPLLAPEPEEIKAEGAEIAKKSVKSVN